MKKNLLYVGHCNEYFIDGEEILDGNTTNSKYIKEIKVKDPLYGKKHNASLFVLLKNFKKYAIAEFSYGIWGIFLIE